MPDPARHETPRGSAPPEVRKTWDVDVAEQLRSLQEPGEPDLVDELLTTFRDESLTIVPRLAECAARGDMPGVAVAAHTLKGAAANLGAQRLVRAASALESAGRRGDRGAIQPMVEEVLDELSRFLAKSGAGGDGGRGGGDGVSAGDGV